MATPRAAKAATPEAEDTAAAPSTESPALTEAPSNDAPIQVLLSRAMGDIGAVAKDSKNTNQNYNFRGIDAVVNAASPAFRRHGIIVLPTLQDVQHEQVSSRNGQPMAQVTVVVTYTFIGPRGDMLAVTVPGEAMDSGDKATPKAMSVAFRIALLQALALPTDDTDPDSQTYERGTAQTREQRVDGGHYERALKAIESATDLDFLMRLNGTVQQFDSNGTFTPEQAGNLYEAIEKKRAEIDTADTPA